MPELHWKEVFPGGSVRVGYPPLGTVPGECNQLGRYLKVCFVFESSFSAGLHRVV